MGFTKHEIETLKNLSRASETSERAAKRRAARIQLDAAERLWGEQQDRLEAAARDAEARWHAALATAEALRGKALAAAEARRAAEQAWRSARNTYQDTCHAAVDPVLAQGILAFMQALNGSFTVQQDRAGVFAAYNRLLEAEQLDVNAGALIEQELGRLNREAAALVRAHLQGADATGRA
jgi:hypothetical protein